MTKQGNTSLGAGRGIVSRCLSCSPLCAILSWYSGNARRRSPALLFLRPCFNLPICTSYPPFIHAVWGTFGEMRPSLCNSKPLRVLSVCKRTTNVWTRRVHKCTQTHTPTQAQAHTFSRGPSHDQYLNNYSFHHHSLDYMYQANHPQPPQNNGLDQASNHI